MSATATAKVLQELGAVPRRFRSARHALLWYRDELARRLRSTRQGFEVGAGPQSREEIDQRAATFAAVAQCLRREHAADVEPESAAWLMSGERVAWLLSSYEASWGDNCWLADRAGLSRWVFTRLCRRTEKVLRMRLEEAGLLEEVE